ncbi:hypothetical protein [Parasphingopyxis marina]|uniref:Uncharacterized protein n=1 Tax=Parasphingopyxis marina TaxID=2761622 RepID=A0A842I3D8_9SPHN|nr:hypothetical protein [Parasphingopyxis marina]MBC2778900.1 hypothetical protein [Parasphingopyxis marina]
MTDPKPSLPSQAGQSEVAEELYGILGFHVRLAHMALKQYFHTHHGGLNLTQNKIAISEHESSVLRNFGKSELKQAVSLLRKIHERGRVNRRGRDRE